MNLFKHKHWNLELFFSIFSAISALLIFGFKFSSFADSYIYIPMLRRVANPSLYQSDFMLNNTFSQMYSLFFYIIGFLTKIFPIYGLLVFLQIIFLSFTAYTIYLLTLSIKNDIYAALVSIFLLIEAKRGFTWHFVGIYHPVFSPPVMVLPLIILSFRNLFLRRYSISFFLAGVSFNIQGQLGLYTFVILSFSYLFSEKKSILKLFKLCGIFLLGSLPAAIMFFMNEGGTSSLFRMLSPLKIYLNYIVRKEAIFPWLCTFRNWLLSPLLLILIGTILMLDLKIENYKKRIFSGIIFGILFMSVIGVIFTRNIPLEFAYRFAFWRSSSFLVFLSVIFISIWSFENLTDGLVFKNIFVWNLITTFFYYSSHFSTSFRILYIDALIPLMILFTLFIYVLGRNRVKESMLFKINTILFVFIVFFSLYFYSSVKNLYENNIIIFMQYFMFLCGVLFIVLVKKIKIRKLIILIILFFVAGIDFIVPFQRKLKLDYYKKNWKDVQQWVKNNSTLKDIFITPPYIGGFRIFSERSPVVEWIDGTQMAQDSNFSLTWWNRMKDFGYPLIYLYRFKNWLGKFLFYNLRLREKDFLKIAQKYNASYLVTEKDMNLNFKKVYENEFFRVYSLRK